MSFNFSKQQLFSTKKKFQEAPNEAIQSLEPQYATFNCPQSVHENENEPADNEISIVKPVIHLKQPLPIINDGKRLLLVEIFR